MAGRAGSRGSVEGLEGPTPLCNSLPTSEDPEREPRLRAVQGATQARTPKGSDQRWLVTVVSSHKHRKGLYRPGFSPDCGW